MRASCCLGGRSAVPVEAVVLYNAPYQLAPNARLCDAGYSAIRVAVDDGRYRRVIGQVDSAAPGAVELRSV